MENQNKKKHYINGIDINAMSITQIRKSLSRTLKSLALIQKLHPKQSKNMQLTNRRIQEKKILLHTIRNKGERHTDVEYIRKEIETEEQFKKHNKKIN